MFYYCQICFYAYIFVRKDSIKKIWVNSRNMVKLSWKWPQANYIDSCKSASRFSRTSGAWCPKIEPLPNKLLRSPPPDIIADLSWSERTEKIENKNGASGANTHAPSDICWGGVCRTLIRGFPFSTQRWAISRMCKSRETTSLSSAGTWPRPSEKKSLPQRYLHDTTGKTGGVISGCKLFPGFSYQTLSSRCIIDRR